MTARLKLISLALIAVSMLTFGTSASVAQEPEQPRLSILGSIEMGKTPMSQFEEEMKAKGCAVENKGEYISVQPGCFQLPGNAEVNAGVGINKSSGMIEAVVLKFDKTQNLANYDLYLQALTRKYGEPYYANENKDEVVAIWHSPFGGIILINKADNTKGALTFLSEPVFSEILKEKLPEAYQCKDLDIL